MNLSFDIKSLGKLLGKKKAGGADRAIGHPSRDFAILLLVVLLGIAGSLAYHVYLFIDMNADDPTANVTGTSAAPIVDASKMKSTLDGIQTKQARFNQLRAVPPAIPDPAR